MKNAEHSLAKRLGKTTHVSSLRMKLNRLRQAFPSTSAACLEDWLVDLANDRGARVVFRENRHDNERIDIPREQLSNEELVVGICQLQCLDRPQMLRLAAQIISRQDVDLSRLCLVAERERAGAVLAELSRQASRVNNEHTAWRTISKHFSNEQPTRDVLLHWTRLAEPVMKNGWCDAQSWKLVA
jgi:hypothetical protein